MSFANPWFTVLILSSIGLFLLETVSVLLNLSRLRPELPEEFRDVFKAEDYAKSQAYTRESERFELISGAVKLAVFLAFWLGGGFGWLDALVRGWTASPIAGGLAGLAVLSLGSSLLSWPFDWWDTFRIEEKYGFNKTTPGVFWVDRIKGLVLSAVIGLPVMALLLWLFGSFPNAWAWAWISVTIIILALQFLAPRYLMPLFNKFTPMPDGPLKTAIHGLSERCGFPVKELFVIDGSKRSSKGNAFFAGFGKNKRIALYDTLIEKHPEPELLAVLAHEIGHFKCGHITQRMGVAVLQLAVVFLLMGLLLNNAGLFAAFGVAQPSVWLSIVFFMILFEPVQTVFGIFSSLWSRKHEYEADAFAANAMRSPQELIDGLKRLAVDNLSNLTPHPFHVFLHYSHPPMIQRLAALRAWRPAAAE